jgi:DNA polymerase-3 subunit gamma/tau
MTTQAIQFGMAELTHASEVVSETLNKMSGATSQKLQLEIMCAKVLVPAADNGEVGSLARIERLERRIGVDGAAAAASAPRVAAPAASTPAATSKPVTPATKPAAQPVAAQAAPAAASEPAAQPVAAIANLTTQHIRDLWPDVLDIVNKRSKAAWLVAYTLQVVSYDPTDDLLTLQFASQRDVDNFKKAGGAPDILRNAIHELVGVMVKFKPAIGATPTSAIPIVEEAPEVAPAAESTPAAAPSETTAPASSTDDLEELELEMAEAQEAKAAEAKTEEPKVETKTKSRNSKMVDEKARYGESLLREMLGAEPVDDKKNGR